MIFFDSLGEWLFLIGAIAVAALIGWYLRGRSSRATFDAQVRDWLEAGRIARSDLSDYMSEKVGWSADEDPRHEEIFIRPTPPADPPRSFFGRIDCPAAVVAEEYFEVTIGIGPLPQPGTTGGRIDRPQSSVGRYYLNVQVVAPAFRPGPDEYLDQTLDITADDPYPTFTIHLAAAPQDEPVVTRGITAWYSISSQTLGMASRNVAVTQTADIVPAEVPKESFSNMGVPHAATPPDLTIRIKKIGPGRLSWCFESPHPVGHQEQTFESDLEEARQFARLLIDDVDRHEEKPTLYPTLRGKGRHIAWKIPREVWTAIREANTYIEDRSPTIFIVSDEPYVPWELALVEEPLLDDQAAEFLGAQAVVGRWALAHCDRGNPPREELMVRDLAVVSGRYEVAGYNRLERAEEEAALLKGEYDAKSIEANTDPVLRCLRGEPAAQILHFAVHGEYDTDSTQNGLVLLDGHILQPDTIAGTDLIHQPFVFLNACQVGTGQSVLGDYAGMAEAFLTAGATAVIAPLWSVADDVARDIAVSFYQRALVDGETPAAILRDERRKLDVADKTPSGTYLAYQFFGHPELRITKEGPA